MIWKTTNALGQPVTWYSKEEVTKAFLTLHKAIDADTEEFESYELIFKTYEMLEELLEVKNG